MISGIGLVSTVTGNPASCPVERKAKRRNGLQVNIPGMENPPKVPATVDATTFPVFGEMALLDSGQRSATVQALGNQD